MVLELVIGDSLRGLLQGHGKLEALPCDIAARIVADACAGLHAAHESSDPAGCPLNIVHRDVSPPNILVSVNGEVKVSDFGIAKARVQYHTRTRTGDIKGKFAYVAPEQVLGGRVDRRADIHSLGCVLYLATLGQRPFGGGPEALGRVVRGEYQDPSAVDPAYPASLQAIVRRALASEPTARYQTADEMRVALEEWLISESRLVLCTDVAKVVRARLNDDQRELVEFLSTMEGSVPEELLVGLSGGGDAADLKPGRGEGALPRPSDAPRTAPSVVGRS
jgi:serine/threonine-protein kinase